MTFGICAQIDLWAFDLMVSNYPDLKAVCLENLLFMHVPLMFGTSDLIDHAVGCFRSDLFRDEPALLC